MARSRRYLEEPLEREAFLFSFGKAPDFFGVYEIYSNHIHGADGIKESCYEQGRDQKDPAPPGAHAAGGRGRADRWQSPRKMPYQGR